MSKTLYMEKRGCDFIANEKYPSDINNHRITTTDYTVTGKDGKKYFLEFIRSTDWKYRFVNKRGTANLKRPVKENRVPFLLVTMQYQDEHGTWSNSYAENIFNSLEFPYTLDSVLSVVNAVSMQKYDSIEFI